MTSAADRRLAKLEGALSPTEAVLAWLAEAQQFATIEDQARAIAELPVEAAPLSVIGQRIEASVLATMKGQPRDVVWEAACSVGRVPPTCRRRRRRCTSESLPIAGRAGDPSSIG